MKALPIIGITTAQDERPIAYARRIREAGGTPLLLRPDRDPDDAFSQIDALLLTGGADIHPALYGEAVDPTAGVESDTDLDVLETGLLRRALDADMPVLGICRGFQLLNVAFGGKLVQDIQPPFGKHRVLPRDGHRPTSDRSTFHEIEVLPGTLLAQVTQVKGRVRVNSVHHQGVTDAYLASSLRSSAYAPDGLVEGLESPRHRWVLGVQCHPERKWEVPKDFQRLFNDLITVAWAGDDIRLKVRVG